MQKNNKARHRGDTPAARKILSALYDLADTLDSGIPLEQKYTVRHIAIAQPDEYGPADIKALRAKLSLSQPVFAQLIGASTILVQKWETGERHPDGMARRLLDDIKKEPKRWMQLFYPIERHAKAG